MYPSSHALGGARNPMHHGVATYPHVDTFNPYLFAPNAYSPPAAARPNLSPHSPIGTITVGSASQTNNNTSISAQSVLPGKQIESIFNYCCICSIFIDFFSFFIFAL